VEDNDISTLDYQDAVFYGFAGYIGMMIIGSMVNLYVSGIKKSSLETKNVVFLLRVSFHALRLNHRRFGRSFRRNGGVV